MLGDIRKSASEHTNASTERCHCVSLIDKQSIRSVDVPFHCLLRSYTPLCGIYAGLKTAKDAQTAGSTDTRVEAQHLMSKVLAI